MAEKKPSRRERVAARVARLIEPPLATEGVVPLAVGYFQVERMRMQARAKPKGARRVKLKSVK